MNFGQQVAERDVLTERDRVALDVRSPGPDARIPDHTHVLHVVGIRPVHHGADQVGAPMSLTALWMLARAAGSLNGSMSVEFSGQITRFGAGTVPFLTSAASWCVASVWLSSTARRSLKAVRPEPGTLPCTAATTTCGEPGPVSGNTAPTATTATAAAMYPAAATACRPDRPVRAVSAARWPAGRPAPAAGCSAARPPR